MMLDSGKYYAICILLEKLEPEEEMFERRAEVVTLNRKRTEKRQTKVRILIFP